MISRVSCMRRSGSPWLMWRSRCDTNSLPAGGGAASGARALEKVPAPRRAGELLVVVLVEHVDELEADGAQLRARDALVGLFQVVEDGVEHRVGNVDAVLRGREALLEGVLDRFAHALALRGRRRHARVR